MNEKQIKVTVPKSKRNNGLELVYELSVSAVKALSGCLVLDEALDAFARFAPHVSYKHHMNVWCAATAR
jgi:hypothetical protein